MIGVARWAPRVLASATASALAVPLLVMPAVQHAAARELMTAVDWASPMSLPEPPALQVTPLEPPGAAGGPTVPDSAPAAPPDISSGSADSSALAGATALSPPPPPPPPPPPLPWSAPAAPLAASAVVRGAGTVTGVQLGPIIHIKTTVAAGAAVTLAPSAAGWPHILCSGPTAPDAEYWLDNTGGGTQVHRYDNSGTYDFYYRNVTAEYLQRQPCS